jgi:hypothetical protein
LLDTVVVACYNGVDDSFIHWTAYPSYFLDTRGFLSADKFILCNRLFSQLCRMHFIFYNWWIICNLFRHINIENLWQEK